MVSSSDGWIRDFVFQTVICLVQLRLL